jgi:diguanylate cyclase (GGDEF)-like protein
VPSILRRTRPSTPADPHPPVPGARTIDTIVDRGRWFAAALTAALFAGYQPPAGTQLPYSRWWGALPVALLVAVNLAGRRWGRAGEAAGRPVRALVGDAVVAVLLVGMFAFDGTSPVWAIVVVPVLEALARGWRRGALVTFAALAAALVAGEVATALLLPGAAFTVGSVTYRLGALAVVAGCAAGLAGLLREQIDRTVAAQAEADRLRAVAVATRRMSSLDVTTVVREMTAAAQAFGFGEVQLRLRSGAVTGPDAQPLPAVPLPPGWFESAVAAAAAAGYVVLDDDPGGTPLPAGELLVVSPVSAGHDADALLVARHAAPLEPRDAEALALLAAQAGAVLANALRYEEGRAFEERLAHESTHDALTGLPNRALLRDRGRTALARSRRHGTLVAVMAVDVDRFKEVNDVLGHATGDALLRQVAERLQQELRAEDTCARVGGDEFVVVSADHEDVEAVLELARRLRNWLSEPFSVGDSSVDIEASMGVAWSPDHGNDIDDLLRRADVAMSAAKQRREGVVVYAEADDQLTPSHLATLGDLRRALDSTEQLSAMFQPIVSVATERLVAVEALVRWQHPSRGQVAPAEFIPLAEGSSVINQLTDHVLDLALASLDGWLKQGLDIHLAVNLSPRTLLDVSLCQRLESLLAHHRIAPDRLRLEITEGTLLADPSRSIATMHRLKDLGLRLSVDDFGTGYASMSYLKSLPVDELKIDRLFVADMLRSARDGAMVNSVIDLAHGLGLHVVAEGVEDQDTLDALCFVGCDLAQGYHVGRPMTSAALLEWAAARGDLEALPDPIPRTP